MVLSVKHYNDKEGEMKGNHVRVILRTTSGTIHRYYLHIYTTISRISTLSTHLARLLPYNDVRDTPSPVQLARLLCPELAVDKFEPIMR